MCEFISHIEVHQDKGIKNYFLSDRELLTKKGQDLIKFCRCDDDLKGHGAIRRYYKLVNHDGVERECTDFSTPSNFPPEIANAIKNGLMTGFNSRPCLLLSTAAEKAYQDAIAPAEKAYYETRATTWKAYQDAITTTEKASKEAIATAWKAYQDTRAAAWKAYQDAIATAEKAYYDTRATAWKAYKDARAAAEKAYQDAIAPVEKAYYDTRATAEKAYQEMRDTAFWNLFADPKNRNPKWI